MKQKKRTLAVLTAMICLMGTPVLSEMADTAVMTANAEDTLTYGDLTYRIKEDGTIIITDCHWSVEMMNVPAEIDNIPVTEIGAEAFAACEKLTEMTIPEGVTKINDMAFKDCKKLTDITLPESLTHIEFQAFLKCTNLERITIPDGVQEIALDAFQYCTALKYITFPDSLEKIGGNAFGNCTSLTSITLPKSLTVMSPSMLEGCTGLKSIVIPEKVTRFSTYVFRNCTALENITIPAGVTKIGTGSFKNCTSLTDVYFTGTEEQWNAIEIAADNELLTGARIHFNSAAPVGTELVLGDPTGDNLINASDAAVVLTAAAKIGAGEDPDLTEDQQKAADVNKDSRINASDTAIILKYAAAVGSGVQNVEIEDFI